MLKYSKKCWLICHRALMFQFLQKKIIAERIHRELQYLSQILLSFHPFPVDFWFHSQSAVWTKPNAGSISVESKLLHAATSRFIHRCGFSICVSSCRFHGFMFLLLQFPVPSHHQKASDHLGLNYVTERILASVLPRRNAATLHQHQQQAKVAQVDGENNRANGNDASEDAPQDVYEEELISMLEQKHGKVSGFCFLVFAMYFWLCRIRLNVDKTTALSLQISTWM